MTGRTKEGEEESQKKKKTAKKNHKKPQNPYPEAQVSEESSGGIQMPSFGGQWVGGVLQKTEKIHCVLAENSRTKIRF